MNAAILLAVVLATGDAPATPLDASVDDPTELLGIWELVEVVDGGDISVLSKGERWIFAGDWVVAPDRAWRIAGGTSRLDRIFADGTVSPGEYHIDRETLIWTWPEWRQYTFRRVPR